MSVESIDAATLREKTEVDIELQALQVLGALLVLIAFAGVQTERFAASSDLSLFLNLLGSAILLAAASIELQIGFMLLDAVWALVSLAALIGRRYRRG